MSSEAKVVLVDDDQEVLDAYRQTLELDGFDVTAVGSAKAGLNMLSPDLSAVVVSDVRMPGLDGFGLLDAVRAIDPDIPVVLVTGHGDVPMAIKAVRAGAWDFIEKPADPVRLVETVRRASAHRSLILENRTLRAGATDQDSIAGRLVGRSAAIERLRRTLQTLADAEADVLLLGETGTGKEVAARALHDFGRRRKGRFVAVNCGAMPETMIESELFGHESGAFTGARERRIGKIEHASGGTLFLDEIESMPMPAQIRLLRVLQERTIERLGSNKEIPVDIRVIAATKADLTELAGKGAFREDLVYRLNVVTVRLPPLRERRDDVPVLFTHFLHLAAARQARAVPSLDSSFLERLQQQEWPGNVRELRNAAERYLLGLDDDEPPQPEPSLHGALTLERQMEIAERRVIEETLARFGWRIGATAEALGITRKTLYLKMKKYDLGRPEEIEG
ncbi:sigma-54-dependent transcriptional regulator [Microvirga guangxiensis]|uniref:Two-component system, NtrC family, C4-dicarboxylate transport response regulator DctD n=1 Tax=Microvirga guangxiensis TaxID=549386 RepID=A0A1G5ASL4_9HYPH|nr:sigma-54 dependent transcriptional regulator [Microvirga guangxiensis]SCX80841.1 two-component system, NtrC family, C4-dicarboxylate transport response regulator DctD [Microvirga guangxiensis]